MQTPLKAQLNLLSSSALTSSGHSDIMFNEECVVYPSASVASQIRVVPPSFGPFVGFRAIFFVLNRYEAFILLISVSAE